MKLSGGLLKKIMSLFGGGASSAPQAAAVQQTEKPQAAPRSAKVAPTGTKTSKTPSTEKKMASVEISVNGKATSGEVEDGTLLVTYLRENLNLTGTHVGCDTSQCGACVVHMDGKAVKACTVLAEQASGSQITTIEGLASGGDLHPVQKAFHENHGLQCGFCTTGMIMTAVDMIERAKANGATLDEASIREQLEGNICRCTGYHNIVKAIESAAGEMA